ncbi:TonB-dependent receptor plug domain-containing protein [Sphingomonas sp. OTU376]|uniref:TonB-dependent receptor plug domain-containing protein n=1 Tax=Sphingomonas sp. OTU376 TaxID=3043863 RepID=UPI00313E1383
MKTTTARLRASAALSAVALAGSLLAAPAFAQDASANTETTAGTATPQQESPSNDGAIVVTGSIFRQSDTHTASPVTVITAENLERAGITNVTDAIRSASADGAGSIGNGFTSGFSAGGAAVSLRNLGVSSTLILVDGLRSTNFPLSDDGHNSYVDLNSIPLVNVQQVQVLKDGASSLYGADAIGGVVNIITRKQMTGLEATVEGGATEQGDGAKYRAKLLFGFGDYDTQGFNVYVGGDYEYGGRISADSRGFPFNTLDLRGVGGNDNNRADDTLGTPTTDAVVTRTTQSDLNNPLAGSVTNATSPALYTSLTPLANCAYGTYSENGTRVGTACKHDLTREYGQITPKQQRYDAVARLSYRIGDNIEGYAAASYANSQVDIINAPRTIRQTQAFGGSPSTSTTNPGIVLPVYICASGVNCATAADRQLNPNNPYAAAYAANPSQGAARIYYLFGDIPAGSKRTNEVFRFTGGLHGTVGDSWDWNVEAGYSHARLNFTQYGWANLNGLVKAINTGAYNFVNPSLNSQAVRDMVAPAITAISYSSELTVDASLSRSLFTLPGGDLKFAVGGQYRKEKLTNNSLNPKLDVPGLTTAQAYGDRTVWAGFFEIDAPVLDILDINLSGRYDHYSTGIGRFSPKAGVKFQPIKQIALRGTYSEGFRAPTFAESDARSSYSGFVGYTPVGDFLTAHAANPSYTAAYSLGRGYVGNPAIKPETARSLTLGAIFEPTSWLSFTADYFNVKKSNLIVTGPKTPEAINAYYSVAGQTFASAAAASAAGCAKVAAVGAGYSCNVIDGADPFAPNALPRLLVLNAPYVNTAYSIIAGLEFTADARIKFSEDFRWESRIDVQETLKYDLHPGSGGAVQRYAGTVGPEDLSSGGGTPRWRGNWQNTFTYNQFSLSTTTYLVGSMKAVAADQASSGANADISCAKSAIYKPTTGNADFCHINSFIYTDVNLSVKVNDQFSFFGLVGNVTNARAPLFANTAYPSQVNTLTSWHAPGLIGRTFRAGANFKF